MSIRTLLKRGGLAVAAVSLLATPTTLTAAQAVQSPAALAGGQAGAICLPAEKDPHGHARARQGRGPDHSRVSGTAARRVNDQLSGLQRQLLAQLEDRRLDRSGSKTSSATTARFPAKVVVNVHVHNVLGSHRAERDIGWPRLRLAVNTLSEHFAGWERAGNVDTQFRFRVVSIENVYSDAFYHAVADSPTDRHWKRKLHRGGAGALNLYIAEHRDGSGSELLGWARFPWEYASAPAQDGVTVHPESLPGRQLAPYNQGDTTTHEVGHWLGLFHVFEGDCANRDGVQDTHAQVALFECVNDDTCLLQAGRAQPFNYMQYTPDRCMQMFTSGQAARTQAAWLKWRA